MLDISLKQVCGLHNHFFCVYLGIMLENPENVAPKCKDSTILSR